MDTCRKEAGHRQDRLDLMYKGGGGGQGAGGQGEGGGENSLLLQVIEEIKGKGDENRNYRKEWKFVVRNFFLVLPLD